MKALNAALLIAIGLLVLYAASKGGFDCLTGAFTCLKEKAK
jgi:hypothetical protein